MTKYEAYLNLLSKTYDEAVDHLLTKYGEVKDDYFRESSYERFLKGEIKSITRGKYSRSSEGLECHHIDENKYMHMTNLDMIRSQNIPFERHKKERLVYADVIEHAILHVLIAKETALELGELGYMMFLKPKIEDWYRDEDMPKKSKHHIACYHKAFIKPEEATQLLEAMDKIIEKENERIHQKKQAKRKQVIEEGNYKTLTHQSSRDDIARATYELHKLGAKSYSYIFSDFVYSEKHDRNIYQRVDFETFKQRLEHYDLTGILKSLHLYIQYVEGSITHKDYVSESRRYAKTKAEIKEEIRAEEERVRLKKQKAAERKKKQDAFYTRYPKFEPLELSYDITRQDVNAELFKRVDNYPSFISFQGAMKAYDINELLEKLHDIILNEE